MSLTIRSNAHYDNFNVSSKYYNTANISLSSPNWQVFNLNHQQSECSIWQNGNLSHKEIKRLFVKVGGAGITFEFWYGPHIKNGVGTECIFLSKLLDHPLYVMFWISNNQGGSKMTQLKKTLLNHKYVIWH